MAALALVRSRALAGLQAPEVVVEVHLAGGLPSFNIVGLAETEVKESRDRVRAALLNAQFEIPARRITVNLAPADLPKESGRFDLPIAIGILVASGQLPADRLDDYEYAGELSLSGLVRPIRGALAMTHALARAGRVDDVPRIAPQDEGSGSPRPDRGHDGQAPPSTQAPRDLRVAQLGEARATHEAHCAHRPPRAHSAHEGHEEHEEHEGHEGHEGDEGPEVPERRAAHEWPGRRAADGVDEARGAHPGPRAEDAGDGDARPARTRRTADATERGDGRPRRRGFVLPRESAVEAALCAAAEVYPVDDLLAACAHLTGETPLVRQPQAPPSVRPTCGDFADVKAQRSAKRALEVAAAGGHSVLMIGPPGTGKSMLASRFPSLLPPMTTDEALESAAIASIADRFSVERWGQRPYRSPHHTASGVALVGGGVGFHIK